MTKLFGKKNGMFGVHHSTSTKKKISVALTEKKLTEEHKKNISKASNGKSYEEIYGIERAKDMRRLRSIESKGKKKSLSARRNMSKAKIGYVVPEKVRKKISLSTKGKMPKHKNNCQCSVCRIMRGRPPYNKGKTLEDLFGEDRAKEIRIHISESNKGILHPNANLAMENNSQWRGGISFEPYGVEFNDVLKQFVRERDNYVCQICKTQENGRKLSVHHIDYNKNNNDSFNLIATCEICHGLTGANRNIFQEFLEEYQEIRFSN